MNDAVSNKISTPLFLILGTSLVLGFNFSGTPNFFSLLLPFKPTFSKIDRESPSLIPSLPLSGTPNVFSNEVSSLRFSKVLLWSLFLLFKSWKKAAHLNFLLKHLIV